MAEGLELSTCEASRVVSKYTSQAARFGKGGCV